jgi:hypothetical protein
VSNQDQLDQDGNGVGDACTGVQTMRSFQQACEDGIASACLSLARSLGLSSDSLVPEVVSLPDANQFGISECTGECAPPGIAVCGSTYGRPDIDVTYCLPDLGERNCATRQVELSVCPVGTVCRNVRSRGPMFATCLPKNLAKENQVIPDSVRFTQDKPKTNLAASFQSDSCTGPCSVIGMTWCGNATRNGVPYTGRWGCLAFEIGGECRTKIVPIECSQPVECALEGSAPVYGVCP